MIATTETNSKAVEHQKLNEEIWSNVQYDFTVRSKLQFQGFKLNTTILETSGVRVLAHRLKMPEAQLIQKYFRVGQYFRNTHPINQLLSETTQKNINQIVRDFLRFVYALLHPSLKYYYTTVKIDYTNPDDKTILVRSYNFVRFDISQKVAESKCVFENLT